MIEKERRPWGWFKVLHRGEEYCVKELYVEPDKRISLQFHRYRTEDWVIVKGSGLIQQGTLETCLLYTSPSPRDLSTSRMPSSA